MGSGKVCLVALPGCATVTSRAGQERVLYINNISQRAIFMDWDKLDMLTLHHIDNLLNNVMTLMGKQEVVYFFH